MLGVGTVGGRCSGLVAIKRVSGIVALGLVARYLWCTVCTAQRVQGFQGWASGRLAKHNVTVLENQLNIALVFTPQTVENNDQRSDQPAAPLQKYDMFVRLSWSS